jgi:hypothetical protein
MESWNARIEEVSEFMETEGFDVGLHQALQFTINFGNENEDKQEQVWESVKAMIRGLDGSPVKRGKKSNLPASVNVVIDGVSREVGNAHGSFFDENNVLQAVLLKHGKSGGGSYANGDEYGAAIAGKTRTLLKKMYLGATNKDDELIYPEWDGSRDNLLETIHFVEVDEEE